MSAEGPCPLPPGFSAGGIHCGLKQRAELDLGLIVADEAYPARALFTLNPFVGAHVLVCREQLVRSDSLVRAVLVNSKNANCGTGERGIEDAKAVTKSLAEIIDCPKEQVLFISTGVIGERLPVEKITAALPELCASVVGEGIEHFARAIMTTDTVPKLERRELATKEGEKVTSTGVAKGSGMIHPEMATMLAFLLTEGRSPNDMYFSLRNLAEQSFHRLSVDGDTSPNDTLLLWSAERHWCRPETTDDGAIEDPFEDQLLDLSQALCRKIAKDGEGATRLITIQVRGATGELEAAKVGRAIARSPLVKTAIFGRDPNWGRILSAAATSGVALQVEDAKVWIGEHVMYAEGRAHPENEAAASRYLQRNEEVVVGVDLGMGPFEAEVWSCDLSTDYVRINAEYRT